MSESTITEIYETIDPVEAHALANVLRQEGFEAQVVGDVLSVGAFPVSAPLSSRVWINRQDEPQAREIVARWEAERQTWNETSAEPSGAGDFETFSVQEQPYSEAAEIEPHRPVIGQVLMATGLAIFLGSVIWGALNWQLLRRYPASTHAQLISEERLAPSPAPAQAAQLKWRAQYEYFVEQQRYLAQTEFNYNPPKQLPIRYNLADPADYTVHPISHPAWIIAIGLILGGFLGYVGWQFR